MDRNAPKPDRIVELGFGFRGARVLMSAVELGVFTALAEVRCDSDTLRRRLELHERGARDFFDALVALRLLQRDDSGSYSNSPDADLYLDRRKPTYIGGLVENLNAREYGMWGRRRLASNPKPTTQASTPIRRGSTSLSRE
jgi:Dimerisation domain